MKTIEMKTYAEDQGKKPFDWNEFLHRETYNEDDLEEATELASSWVTCACGNMCDAIPRKFENGTPGIPEDHALKYYGFNFYNWISDMHFLYKSGFHKNCLERKRKLALQMLRQIEKRSKEILTEMGILTDEKDTPETKNTSPEKE